MPFVDIPGLPPRELEVEALRRIAATSIRIGERLLAENEELKAGKRAANELPEKRQR